MFDYQRKTALQMVDKFLQPGSIVPINQQTTTMLVHALREMTEQRPEATKKPEWITEEMYFGQKTWTPKIEQVFDVNGVLIAQTIKYTPNGIKEPYPHKKQRPLLSEQLEALIPSFGDFHVGGAEQIWSQHDIVIFEALARMVEKAHGITNE